MTAAGLLVVVVVSGAAGSGRAELLQVGQEAVGGEDVRSADKDLPLLLVPRYLRNATHSLNLPEAGDKLIWGSGVFFVRRRQNSDHWKFQKLR